MYNIVKKSAEGIYSIGDTGPAGGGVFYISNGGQNGLEAARDDLAWPSGELWYWGCGGTEITGAAGTAIGTGAINTADILAACTEPNVAAKGASDFTLNGYDDWFLASKDEMSALYAARSAVGGFTTNTIFWTSSQDSAANAWNTRINTTGYQQPKTKTLLYKVRPIRAF